MSTSDANSDPQPAASTEVKVMPRPKTPPPAMDQLPPFVVLLHNDDHNDMLFVVQSISGLTGFNPERSIQIMLEAHKTGLSRVLTTHRERAELYVEQFKSLGLTATCEPEVQ